MSVIYLMSEQTVVTTRLVLPRSRSTVVVSAKDLRDICCNRMRTYLLVMSVLFNWWRCWTKTCWPAGIHGSVAWWSDGVAGRDRLCPVRRCVTLLVSSPFRRCTDTHTSSASGDGVRWLLVNKYQYCWIDFDNIVMLTLHLCHCHHELRQMVSARSASMSFHINLFSMIMPFI